MLDQVDGWLLLSSFVTRSTVLHPQVNYSFGYIDNSRLLDWIHKVLPKKFLKRRSEEFLKLLWFWVSQSEDCERIVFFVTDEIDGLSIGLNMLRLIGTSKYCLDAPYLLFDWGECRNERRSESCVRSELEVSQTSASTYSGLCWGHQFHPSRRIQCAHNTRFGWLKIREASKTLHFSF